MLVVGWANNFGNRIRKGALGTTVVPRRYYNVTGHGEINLFHIKEVST